MKKELTILNMLVAVFWAVACTSSNSATSINSNAGYDTQYREQTRSQSSYPAGEEPTTPEGDPPITLMMIGMETGMIHPGDDYYVYAVVENPDSRNIQYEWSIANGEVRDVPEAERGRLITLLAEEKQYALNPVQEPAVSATAQSPEVTEPAPAEQTPETSQPTTPATSQPAGSAPPAGSALPAGRPNTGGGTSPAPSPSGSARPSTSGKTGERDVGGESPFSSELGNGSKGTKSEEPKPGTQSLDKLLPEEQELYLELTEKVNSNTITPDEKAQLRELERKLMAGNLANDGKLVNPEGVGLIERRIVSGPESDGSDDAITLQDTNEQLEETTTSGSPDGDAAQLSGSSDTTEENPAGLTVSAQSAVAAARAALAELGDEELSPPSGNIAVKTSPRYLEEPQNTAMSNGEGQIDAASIRGEYQTWQGMDGTARRRPLGSVIPDESEIPTTADGSFEMYTFVTDEPFIVWTPSTEGDVTIYARATYKDEVITEVQELPVTVELREPSLTISDEFPDVIKEDDSVIVQIFGENIPEFFKGLVTLTFDINVLSFRAAELGEFFDDAPDAELFEAQADKTQGRVLFAIDSNTEITELSGSDPIIYVKFKAKQDIDEQSQTALALITDSSASYILNRDGDNVLPIPVERPRYRSAIVEPPVLDTTIRPSTGNNAAPNAQAAGGSTTPPAASTPQRPTTTNTGGAGNTTTKPPEESISGKGGSSAEGSDGAGGGGGEGADTPKTENEEPKEKDENPSGGQSDDPGPEQQVGPQPLSEG